MVSASSKANKPQGAKAKKVATEPVKKKAPAPAPAPAMKVGSSAKQYLTCQDGTSNKFWQIETVGSTTTVTFGRIGDGGSTSVKDHGDATAAAKFAAKMVAEKAKKGYTVATMGEASEEGKGKVRK